VTQISRASQLSEFCFRRHRGRSICCQSTSSRAKNDETKGNAYPGEHPAIVDEALWDQVQAVLAENRVDREIGSYAKQPSLLAGLVFDETGERLTPSHAVKKGTRYRYYVSRSLIVGSAKDHSKGRRIPAGNLESLVLNRLRAFFMDQGAILDAVHNEHPDGTRQKRLISRGREIAEQVPTMAPDQTRAMLMALVVRVDLKPDCGPDDEFPHPTHARAHGF
jgi:site-specific DNA recombinase